tara:strand:- start:335 stop:805 length:471 start_codon:yes stop_codon:yes gene_type:complete
MESVAKERVEGMPMLSAFCVVSAGCIYSVRFLDDVLPTNVVIGFTALMAVLGMLIAQLCWVPDSNDDSSNIMGWIGALLASVALALQLVGTAALAPSVPTLWELRWALAGAAALLLLMVVAAMRAKTSEGEEAAATAAVALVVLPMTWDWFLTLAV